MRWTGIVDEIIIGRFKNDEENKLISTNNCDFMDKIFFALYLSKSPSFKVKCAFEHGNAPPHVSVHSLNIKDLRERRKWNGHNLNPIENIWSLVKIRLHGDDKAVVRDKDYMAMAKQS